ncbi:immunity 49 family protein [Streptomyces galbus]|uniref:immunity 49 family protein n=1 Tax=Streptomyces galbus TaxID=33898 RepID=UPI00289A087D|nr:Imm49 family immunity protein [Streptomyces galbus]
MRIERHQVGGAAVSAAREDFTNRIGRTVRSLSRGGRIGTSVWQAIADEFLDHLGALSVEAPDLDTPEARAVLNGAAEAAAGAVAYAAYHPHSSFQVFLEYVNFGTGYDPGDDAPVEHISPRKWVDALCLAVLRDQVERHGEAFHFARQKFAGDVRGTPAGELATGLTAVVLDDTGTTEEHPPTPPAKVAAVDAALRRIRVRADETGEPLLGQPDSAALRTLRALAAGDRPAFDAALAEVLLAHSRLHGGPSAAPSSLLPLVPLALAALAYRTRGWAPAVRTDYLPHAWVTGFEHQGPRVAGFGRDRRPDAVAALAAGPLVVERPDDDRTLDPEVVAFYQEQLREALTPTDDEPASFSALVWALDDQERLFKWRAAAPGGVTDAVLADLRLVSRMASAVFRIALAEPGTEVEVTLDGRPLRYRARRGEAAGAGSWHRATSLALITGVREDLAPLVLTGPLFTGPDGSAFAAYRQALHAYLTGADPERAAQRALEQDEKAKDWGFAMPPAVLLSQLVEGDEESFDLALADALEAHRAYYQVADRADDPDAGINLDILGLACHARRRGWAVRVESPYLPQSVLREARAF